MEKKTREIEDLKDQLSGLRDALTSSHVKKPAQSFGGAGFRRQATGKKKQAQVEEEDYSESFED